MRDLIRDVISHYLKLR